MVIRTIFFDFDGVLTTDKNGSRTICRNLAEKSGIPFEKLYQCFRPFIPDLIHGRKTQRDIWQQFVSCAGKPIDVGLLDYAFRHVPFDAAMMELAHELKQQHTLGIITDNSYARFSAITDALCLDSLFHPIIVSGTVGSTKKDKKIFEIALREAKARAHECVFIDNIADNLVVPKEMGFHTIFFDDEMRDINALKGEISALQKM